MIAFHFPPFAGSSGVQRALRFATHLPEFGWEPIVLAPHPRAYESLNYDSLRDVPPELRVLTTPAWDAKRHLGIAGRYPGFLGRPDRWRSWWVGAVPYGLLAIRKYAPSVIWSTFPIATAHAIGASLARISRLPWVADFRDPMAQDGYPPDPKTWRSFSRLERLTMARSNIATFTTPSAVRTYQERYPQRSTRIRILENGYDEGTFANIALVSRPLNPGRITLLHSGIVYPRERDPTALFEAMRQIRDVAPHILSKLMIRFRASFNDDMLQRLARQIGVHEHIETLPMTNYRDAAQEMADADGLLVLQASNCNAQIPAKLYEYFRARRPMLVLADPSGDTAAAARAAGVRRVVALEDAQSIRTLIESFVDDPEKDSLPIEDAILNSSRRSRTRELAAIFDHVLVNPS